MSKKRILVVEDSPVQLTVLKRILVKNDFEVITAGNGMEAIEILEAGEEDVNLVITDVLMPEMDGYELTKRIKSDEYWRSIPVILLTQLNKPEDIFRGLEVGADNYITKPYEEDYLIARIKYILLHREVRIEKSELSIKIHYKGKEYSIGSDRIQILDMLITTVEEVMRKQKELEETNEKLKKSLEKIQTLSGLLPICANCKKIRDDDGYWHQVEEYVSEHADVKFTHGLCPDCIASLYPEYVKKMREKAKTKKSDKRE